MLGGCVTLATVFELPSVASPLLSGAFWLTFRFDPIPIADVKAVRAGLCLGRLEPLHHVLNEVAKRFM